MSSINVKVKCENGVWMCSTYPPRDNPSFFGDRLLEAIKKYPERIGQIDGLTGKTDNYASMLDRAVRCAIWMRKQGIKPGDVIGFCTNNHLDTFVPPIASIFNGVIFHPWWNLDLDEDKAKYYLNLGEPRVMFVEAQNVEIIQKAIKDLKMNTKLIAFQEVQGQTGLHDILKLQNEEEVKNFECAKITDQNKIAMILCTSGTTGYPKGILESYNFIDRCICFIHRDLMKNSSVLWFSAVGWISGIGTMLSCIKNSGTAIIYSKPNAQIACELIEKYRIECLSMGTAHANQFYNYEGINQHDLSSVKIVRFGGASVTREVHANLSKIFPNAGISYMYGSSEFGITTPTFPTSTKLCSSGSIEEYCQLKIIDRDTGKTLGVNEQGEIVCKSPYIMQGYHKNPAATKEAFDDEGWFHSGDLGYFDADGDLFVVDRLKDVIKFRVNTPIVPSIIEAVIRRHPEVLDVGVVPKPDLVDVEVPMGFVTLRSGAMATEEEIIKLVEDNLPDHMRLRGGVRILDKMPTTVSGKISKKDLKLMVKS